MPATKSYLVVYNPCSGNKGLRCLKKLTAALLEKGYSYDIYHTEKDTQSSEQKIKRRLKKHTDVVAIGGDGTLNMLSNALANSHIPLGIIPCGTGNDFSRNVYNKADNIIEAVTSDNYVKIDLGWCNDRYFINVLGVGYDAIVAECVKNNNIKYLRSLIYIWSALKHLPFYADKKVSVKSESFNKHEKTFMVVFGNGQYFGNGMNITPNANFKDGLLDCCWVGKLSFVKKLQCFAKLFFGNHLSESRIEYSQGNKFQVLSKGHAIEADGELFGYTPADIRVEKKALYLKIPI